LHVIIRGLNRVQDVDTEAGQFRDEFWSHLSRWTHDTSRFGGVHAARSAPNAYNPRKPV
jgi:hypothetical protein